jgi:hypothetical protein
MSTLSDIRFEFNLHLSLLIKSPKYFTSFFTNFILVFDTLSPCCPKKFRRSIVGSVILFCFLLKPVDHLHIEEAQFEGEL